ncbi:hypothetical protein KUCAC02_037114 [Chaenocephalus aceratus]|nr:hypothetical protein KUCAC02_037114 [Chaenocephalus aceratus]
MAFLAVAQVFCEEPEPKEESDYWTSSNQIQDGWMSRDPFREILLRMTRKPRPHQFIGLMGKRSMANAQITRKSEYEYQEEMFQHFRNTDVLNPFLSETTNYLK